jgi:hypothetical protein
VFGHFPFSSIISGQETPKDFYRESVDFSVTVMCMMKQTETLKMLDEMMLGRMVSI